MILIYIFYNFTVDLADLAHVVCRHSNNVSVTQVDHPKQSPVITHPFPKARLAAPGGIRMFGYGALGYGPNIDDADNPNASL